MRSNGHGLRTSPRLLEVAAIATAALGASACSPIITKQIYIGQAEDALRVEYEENLAGEWARGSVLERIELRQGESATFPVRVIAGEAAGVLAACDQDCNGLNLELRDADGFPVDRVISGVDNRPFATVPPGPAQELTAEIAMVACESNPCFVSYWVMRSPSPEVGELIAYYEQSLASQWRPVGPTQRGTLEQLTSSSYALDFLGGENASVVAACDPDCVELNIQVVDSDGFPVDQTMGGTERTPVSAFTVTTAGTYRLIVGMAGCNDEPCSFAYWILQRQGAADDG
ncbi:MAG: hypothetical protein R3195_00375 [Gemmatimonadota bacterium]|nr:hypothetical protein [Gemmatimonadota bacterium]